MRFEQLDLNLFQVFDVIYREGNLTRAAEALSITQPAVSNALARLRDSLDDPLFQRSGRVMLPTLVAQNMIGPVRQALRQLQSSVMDREIFDPAASERVLQLSLGDITASMLLPDLMRQLKAAAPGIRLRCFQLERGQIAAELAAGRLDLAIDIAQLSAPMLNSVELSRDRYVCLLRRRHPLAHSPLRLDEYLALDHVTVSSRRRGASYVDMALNRAGHRLSAPLRLQNYQTAIHVVLNSDMALSAPLSLAQRYEVATKELPFEIEPLDSLLFWHRNADGDPAIAWLRDLIVRTASIGLSQVAR